MTPGNIEVIYFDARGRAEILRILLAAAGKQYKDVRLNKETWPAEKPIKYTPFGQLPCIELDGKRYGQSVAIATYLAREYGFYGKTNLESLEIDQVVQLTQDFISVIVKAMFNPDESKKVELVNKLKEEDGPKFVGLFEKLLSQNGSGYFVGSSMTLADIYVYDIIDSMKFRNIVNIDNSPNLKKLIQNVETNEKIKTYLQNRKPTET